MTDGYGFRVLNGATQASHAMLGARCKATDWARKRAIHAWPAHNSFHVPALVENLGDQVFGKLESIYVDKKSIRPGDDVRNLFGFYMVAMVTTLRNIFHSFFS